MKETQLAIIGSGPAGFTAAVYAARAQLQPVILTGQELGGQLMLTTDVENFPGFPQGKSGPELMVDMQAQATRFGTEMVYEYATFVDVTSLPFRVWTGYPTGMNQSELSALSNEEYHQVRRTFIASNEPFLTAKALLLSMGAATVWLSVPGEAALRGRGVSSCAVCDAAFYRDKVTYVVGGGDSAMEDTLALTKFAKSVTVIHRRDSFRASKIMQERVLQHPKVNVLWNSQVTEVLGETQVTGIRVQTTDPQTQHNREQQLPADGVFVAIGHKPISQIVANQVKIDSHGFVITRRSVSSLGVAEAQKHLDKNGLLQYPTMTTIDGVFAAGDLVDTRYKQAITAAGSGCEAALDAERWLEAKM